MFSKAEDLRLYYRDIEKSQLISRKEEKELAIRIEKGAKAALGLQGIKLANPVNDQERKLLKKISEIRSRSEELTEAQRIKENSKALYALERLVIANAATYQRKKIVEKVRQIMDGFKAKEELALANLRLVVHMAKKYQGRGIELADLIAEGNIGLMIAVEQFDWTFGVRFSTYAVWWIKQSITKALKSNAQPIRVPVHLIEKIAKYKRVNDVLYEKFGEEPSAQELAEKLGWNPAMVAEIAKNAQKSGLQKRRSKKPLEELSEYSEPPRIEPLDYEDLKSRIERGIKKLFPKEQEVLAKRFGFGSQNPCTLAEIGRSMGLSKERIRQIETRSLKRLFQDKNIRGLSALLAHT